MPDMIAIVGRALEFEANDPLIRFRISLIVFQLFLFQRPTPSFLRHETGVNRDLRWQAQESAVEAPEGLNRRT